MVGIGHRLPVPGAFLHIGEGKRVPDVAGHVGRLFFLQGKHGPYLNLAPGHGKGIYLGPVILVLAGHLPEVQPVPVLVHHGQTAQHIPPVGGDGDGHGIPAAGTAGADAYVTVLRAADTDRIAPCAAGVPGTVAGAAA